MRVFNRRWNDTCQLSVLKVFFRASALTGGSEVGHVLDRSSAPLVYTIDSLRPREGAGRFREGCFFLTLFCHLSRHIILFDITCKHTKMADCEN